VLSAESCRCRQEHCPAADPRRIAPPLRTNLINDRDTGPQRLEAARGCLCQQAIARIRFYAGFTISVETDFADFTALRAASRAA
jgi:hypothetical protein